MTEPKTIDVSHLPPYDISNQAPLWWGQLLLAAIEGMMFCILIAAFFYVRLRMDVWPPPGDQFPPRLMPTIALLPLFLSCIGTYWASEAAKKDAKEILDLFGWETVDMGAIEGARAIEPLCVLWCIPGFLRNEWSHAFKLVKA